MQLPLDRETLRASLVETLAANPGVLAVWEAGSAAFGREDEYSDLDLGVLAAPGANGGIWSDVAELCARLGGVRARWHEPNPLFAGLDKVTYRLERASRWLQLDLGIFTHPAECLYNQPEIHGRHRVLHDPQGLVRPPAWDEAAYAESLRTALHHQVMRFGLYHDYFQKELRRGHSVDAFRMYFSLCVRPVVAALRMLHCPERWDFDLRYLHDDLPQEAVAAVQRLCYVPGPSELEVRWAEARRLFGATVLRLAERGLVPLDPSGEDVPLDLNTESH